MTSLSGGPPILSADDAASALAAGERSVLVHARAAETLAALPDRSVDCAITSPPYWSVRRYHGASVLGEEPSPDEYVTALVTEVDELRRVLKTSGSFWLNLGDTYLKKNLCGIPWKVAFELQSRGFILRNAVVWDKVKGNPDNSKDKLRDLYEFVFHFVISPQYFYDVDAIRRPPAPPVIKDGVVRTATGVSGVKYRRQIERSQDLSDDEKQAAHAALDEALRKVKAGTMPDFRMIIRGQQRTTHSEAEAVSGRASEIAKRGYCVLPYHARGSKPGDVWQIIPEDAWRTDSHAAVFPEDLCRLPILATAPPEDGLVFDPFSGTGTALQVAGDLGRRAIGCDTSLEYLTVARQRLGIRRPDAEQLALSAQAASA